MTDVILPVDTAGDGVTTTFAVPFGYVSRAHVLVYLAGVLQDDPTDYTWLDDANIDFAVAPAEAAAIRFDRQTPASPEVTFRTGALSPAEMNKATRQGLYLAHEIRDRVDEILEQVSEVVGGVPDSAGSSWMDGLAPAIIQRGTPKFLMPEMYIGLETQIIYCPGEADGFSGGTDFSSAFAAMHEQMRDLGLVKVWPPTGVGAFRRVSQTHGIALQPGHRYRVTESVPMWGVDARGFTLQGNGATICADYAGGKAVVDMLGSSGWNVRDLGITSNNTAIPDILCLIGTPGVGSLGVQGVDMSFSGCYFVGWANKAGLYNYGAEVSNWHGGEISTIAAGNKAPDAILYDCRNEHDVATYTNNDEVDVEVGDVFTTGCHYVGFATIRTQTQGSPPRVGGAISINGSVTGSASSARNFVFDQVYVVNVRGSGSSPHPGIRVKGEATSIRYQGHQELISHLVWFDKSWGNYNHRTLEVMDHNANPTEAVIGASADANYVNILGLRAEISRSTTGTAKMFGANLDTSVVCGSILAGGSNDELLNFEDIQDFYGDASCLFGGTALGGLSLGSRLRLNTVSATPGTRGFNKLSTKVMSADGALAVDDCDVIFCNSLCTAITDITNGNRYSHEFTIVNDTAGNIAVTGLEGGGIMLASKQTLVVTQYDDKFYA